MIRQQLAVGLESGEILIYSKSGVSTESWRLDVTITSRLVGQTKRNSTLYTHSPTELLMSTKFVGWHGRMDPRLVKECLQVVVKTVQ